MAKRHPLSKDTCLGFESYALRSTVKVVKVSNELRSGSGLSYAGLLLA
jgi:hypothetical protein